MICRGVALLLFFLSFSLSFSPPAASQTILSADSLSVGARSPYLPAYKLREGWRFRAGHDPAWSNPSFDDAEWQVLHRPFPQSRCVVPDDEWTGSGWFRLKLRLAEDLRFRPLAFLFSAIGGAELYVEGELLGRLGSVGNSPAEEAAGLTTDAIPMILGFDPEGRASLSIAVRFSNHWAADNPQIQYYTGFDVGVSELSESADRVSRVIRNRTTSQVFFSASIASIALLHFMFYLFYSRVRLNLLYAIYTVCLAIAAFMPVQIYVFVGSVEALWWYDVLWKMTLVLAVVVGHAFFYDVFADASPTYARWAVAPLAILLFAVGLLPVSLYYAVLLVSFLELIWITLIAIHKGREGSIIIGAGLACLIVTTTHVLLIELGLLDPLILDGYLYGFLCLVLSMAVFLARRFARTSRELLDRAGEVKALSERKVDQERALADRERVRQEADVQQRMLQTENESKRKEIEASRRRQEILERLEVTTDKIRQTQGQLLQSEKMAALGNLVAGIAHEINTPVGAVNSMHDTLLRAVDRLKETILADPELAEDRRVIASLQVMDDANRVISTGTERVTHIVRSLRTFARLDDAEMRDVDLHEGLDNTIPLIQHQLAQGVEIERVYGEIPMVPGYPSRLNQVFLNLLVNATQAIRGAGKVTIATSADPDRVTVTIADTGVGIPPKNLSRVFDPGFTTKGVGVGTGLGLSICYQIIQDHMGEISIASVEGSGTTVTVTLPRFADGRAS